MHKFVGVLDKYAIVLFIVLYIVMRVKLHLLLFITAKYAFFGANRQSIKRIYIHEAAVIYAKRTLICEFWSFNCAFGHSIKKNNYHLREYLYRWRETKIQVRQSKVNSVNITFSYIFSTLIDKQ